MEQFIWETAEELDQKLAQRVRNIRKRRLISQEKLASLSGVSDRTDLIDIFDEDCYGFGYSR